MGCNVFRLLDCDHNARVITEKDVVADRIPLQPFLLPET